MVSQDFPVTNGVRQGSVNSPIYFCVYMDDLLRQCRKKGTGCYLGNIYAAIFGYADDLLLCSPSIQGLQDLIDTASSYADSHAIAFSTDDNPNKSKTKAMILSTSAKQKNPAPIMLNGRRLPWVKSAKYLGCLWSARNDGHQSDMNQKRGIFVSNNHTMMQEFPLAHPEVKTKLIRVYNSSFYGYGIWDL